MKTMMKILTVSLLTLVFFSCKKSDPGSSSLSGGSMSGKVDGTSWTATLAVQATKSGSSFSVAGTGSAGQININIASYTGVGTYTIGSAGNPGSLASYTLTASPFTAHVATFVLGTGTVTVTQDGSGKIVGTFSFDGKNNSGPAVTTKLITEGSFSANL